MHDRGNLLGDPALRRIARLTPSKGQDEQMEGVGNLLQSLTVFYLQRMEVVQNSTGAQRAPARTRQITATAGPRELDPNTAL
jgi:hypothetical protein